MDEVVYFGYPLCLQGFKADDCDQLDDGLLDAVVHLATRAQVR